MKRSDFLRQEDKDALQDAANALLGWPTAKEIWIVET